MKMRYRLIIDADATVTAQIVDENNQIISDSIRQVFDAFQRLGIEEVVRKNSTGNVDINGDYLVVSTSSSL